jgi:beta-N-acetylhexosaminidase
LKIRPRNLLYLGISSALVLGGLGLLIQDPIVYPWRPVFSAILVGAAIVGLAASLPRYPWLAITFLASALLVVWEDAQPVLARRSVLARSGPMTAGVERHFIVGYSDIGEARRLVRGAHVGGIFLTRRNVAGRSVRDVVAEVADLQSIRRVSGLPPLMVAADQEGGPVSHLSPPLPPPPALSSLAALGPIEAARGARQLGMDEGAALRRLGITMDFAPVCDLTPTAPGGAFDWTTRIATRSISADPAVVAAVASGFAAGLAAAGIMPTAKHFPGLGRVTTDTHLFGASLDVAKVDLQASDWIPFRAVLQVPGAAVMLSHVALARVDPGVPASRSRRLVSGILRDTWGFSGIAVTDDLGMGAVEHAGLCRAVEGALNAGIDLLLVAWDTDKVYPALQCALDSLDAGRLDPAMLRASAHRLDVAQSKGGP